MKNYEFEVREAPNEERTLSAIAVPYDETISVQGIKEKFERGSIPSVQDVKLFYGHETPIGKVLRGQETDGGFLIEARISETEKGDEVLTLLRDGVLNKMSVGFRPVKDRDEDGVVVREEVELKEVSVVAFPAYKNADLISVREEESENLQGETTMEETNTEVAEMRSALDDLSREVSLIQESAPSAQARTSYATYGDFVKAVCRGEEDALEMTRAYAGAVVSDAGPDSIGRDAWVNEALLLVDMGRPSLNAFRKAGLPEAGLNIDFPSVKTNTIGADVQASQGDTLSFGKLSLETKTTPVLTIGGWTDVSRQTIERSSVAYLSEVFRAMAIAYGKETNAQFISAMSSGTYTQVSATSGDTASIADAVADASLAIYSQAGGRPQFVLASADVWKDLVGTYGQDGRPILGMGSGRFENYPTNVVGQADLPTMYANIFGLPVITDPALPAGTCYIANSNAITTWENGGPTRLSDEDITNLTSQFSVYGYVAFGLIYPEMVVEVSGLGTTE